MVRRLLAIAVLTGGLAACGGSGRTSDGEAVHYLFDHLHARQAVVAGVKWYRGLDEVHPAASFVTATGRVHRVSDAFVVGTVVEVEEGAGFVARPDGPSIRVAFDAEDARWRTAHAVVAVEQAWGAAVAGSHVQVGIAFDGGVDRDVVLQAIGALGRVAAPLVRSPVFSYDGRVLAVVADGALLATVDAAGRLALPALDDHEESRMLAATPTVASLAAVARNPAVVPLRLEGRVLVRG